MDDDFKTKVDFSSDFPTWKKNFEGVLAHSHVEISSFYSTYEIQDIQKTSVKLINIDPGAES